MKYIALVLIAFLPIGASAALTIGVTKVPTDTNGAFSATVVGGSTNDRTRNPCYQLKDCELKFFTIDESWLPSGRKSYLTTDRTGWQTPQKSWLYETVGEWWAAVENKSREGSDHLPAYLGSNPCVVVAAEYGGMRTDSIISNCARGLVQARTCFIKPDSINIATTLRVGEVPPEIVVPGVTMICTQDASVSIETNTGEVIPLGWNSNTYAILNWGAGYGKKHRIYAPALTTMNIDLRAKIMGVESNSAGVLSGSAVVNITYN